ncbi:DNA-binding response regulator [Streptomyces sp. SID8381]|uniref:response regulator transcription factor n=1 Tax=unclassified Streptomyces TaxID=2593676 RepID=UPI0003795E30|nr:MULTISPECIES: response regulator transcription factor [unclassified Streptomyces]MYX29061.1 DNA-binding response regulator [Streptomyces sp. SID8381]
MSKRVYDKARVRVTLVERDASDRSNLRDALAGAGVDLVAETGEIHRAQSLATASFSDVVVMGLDWPGGSAVQETCRSLVETVGVRGVVAMTRDCADGMLLRSVLMAGVRGYAARSASPADIAGMVHAVADGALVIDPSASWLIAELLTAPFPAAGGDVASALTRREQEVLELVARGYDNRRIARCLTLADKTVRNHVSAIFTKIGVRNRAHAVVRARQAGFGLAH